MLLFGSESSHAPFHPALLSLPWHAQERASCLKSPLGLSSFAKADRPALPALYAPHCRETSAPAESLAATSVRASGNISYHQALLRRAREHHSCFRSACEAVEKTFGPVFHSERGCDTQRADEKPRKAWREAAQRAEKTACVLSRQPLQSLIFTHLSLRS